MLIDESYNVNGNLNGNLNSPWNLNSLTAYNYLKVSLLGAYVAIKKFDVVCLSETFLDLSKLSGPTTHQIQKKVVFASISKTLSL